MHVCALVNAVVNARRDHHRMLQWVITHHVWCYGITATHIWMAISTNQLQSVASLFLAKPSAGIPSKGKVCTKEPLCKLHLAGCCMQLVHFAWVVFVFSSN